MVRTPCRDERGMKKGTWTLEEDRLLIAYVTRYGCWNWRQLPKFAGLARCGKSCRLRWLNYLRPNVKRGNYTNEEEEIIIRLHAMLGNKWSAIAAELEGRTDNEVKNHWHTNLKKRVMNSKNNKAPSSSISITRHEEIEAPKTRDHQPKSATTSSIASDSENVDTTNVVDPHKIYLVEYLDYAGLWSPQPTSSSELSSVANDATAFVDAASDGVRVMEDNATSGAAIDTFYGDFGGSFWTNSSFLGDNYSYDLSGLYTPPPLMEPEEFLYPSFDGEFMYAL